VAFPISGNERGEDTMLRSRWPQAIWVVGLALQLGGAPAFAQSTPATTPSTPPVTTPPPPGAQPPTGGPDALPPREPANAISSGTPGDNGLSKGANSFTEAQARERLQKHGYGQVSALTKDQDGVWHGSAIRNGRQVHVGLDYRGNISSN
jgi:periplasmic protein CpxP/Spy